MHSACAELYCRLWPVRVYSIFPHYLINGMIFFLGGGELLNIKCVFWFLLQLLSGTFHILRRIKQDNVINIHRYSCKVTHSCQILMNLNFFYSSEEYSDIKFHENPSSGSPVVPCGQADMTKLIAAFHNFANATENWIPTKLDTWIQTLYCPTNAHKL